MADNPQPDGERFADQPTYLRFDPITRRAELSIGDDVWHNITYATLVQAPSWSARCYSNLPN
jgi:hypothetical protein